MVQAQGLLDRADVQLCVPALPLSLVPTYNAEKLVRSNNRLKYFSTDIRYLVTEGSHDAGPAVARGWVFIWAAHGWRDARGSTCLRVR